MIEAATWLVVLVGIVALLASMTRRRSGGPGSAAAGAVYELLQEDKRKALEIIVDEKAGARDPEHADDQPTAGATSRRSDTGSPADP